MATKKGNGRPGDLSTAILVQIRDEMRRMHGEQRATNARLGTTNERLDTTIERLDTTNDRLDRLERRQSEDAMRLASELVAVAKAVGEVRDLLRDQRIDRTLLEDHEKRLVTLEKKTA